jgi:hypothetical protein
MWTPKAFNVKAGFRAIVPFTESPAEVHQIIKDLIDLKAEGLEDFGEVYATFRNLSGKEANTARLLSLPSGKKLPLIYTVILKNRENGFQELYNRLAFQLGKQIPPGFAAILELSDYECLRTDGVKPIFQRPNRRELRKQSKRMLQLNKLMSLCEQFIREN